ncbi:hypothetical protein V2J09_009691 [Rumex salicifolius]
MDASRKNQVSLRGASAKEITRDALLEKVSHERELRNFARRASSAALFIQRVWRGYHVTKRVSLQLQEDWEILIKTQTIALWQLVRLRRERCGITKSRECDVSRGDDIAALMSLAVRLIITLSDLKGWRCIDKDHNDAIKAVDELVLFMGSDKCSLYKSIGRFISTLNASSLSLGKNASQPDGRFFIIAGIITLALRPFQAAVNLDITESVSTDMHSAVLQYCVFILSVPWLILRVPAVLLPALRHRSIMEPCLRTLLISSVKVLEGYSLMDQLGYPSAKMIPRVGWALSNIVCLGTESDGDLGQLSDGVDCAVYICVINNLAENFLSGIENFGCAGKEHQGLLDNEGRSTESDNSVDHKENISFGSTTFLDLLRPVCQQWHLLKLMTIVKRDASENENDGSNSIMQVARPLQFLDIAYLYSNMIRIYSILNFKLGSLPVLNMLSFTPGFLVSLWAEIESSLLSKKIQAHVNKVTPHQDNRNCEKKKKQKQPSKETNIKWVATLHKITRKSQADHADLDEGQLGSDRANCEDLHSLWDVECLRGGPQSISKDTNCLLHLFCSTYAHLLLVLDDIEFYERQIPFSLEQQRSIASVLNTLVYNGLLQTGGQQNRLLMNAATKCLQMLYERDCRHQFCPPDLWLAPARQSRPPIATAARIHEVSSSRVDDSVIIMNSFITTIPYVYPFEERVEMFREFVKRDKSCRKIAGELIGPGERSIEIVVRRGHIIEDGFRQLNSMGSKLKSSIHVSFVGESGLPEAGLDYGGLSKEFLTDIAKAAFDPEYGLFCQTSTSERLIIPSTSARFQEKGIQMIEFLGRIVGKALYEGILLDYSFSHAFVQKLLGRYSFIDELSTLDPELYKNLMYVKSYDGDIKELSLDFTITEESLGQRQIVELKPGGKDINVTNDNKLQYIHAMADYKLNRQILPLSNTFYRGLTDLISPSWLKLFNASEFNQLLSGGMHDIDVDDLRNNTRYTGGYTEGSRAVKLFWEVMAGFEPEERCLLLKFVTSCSRAPLLGFKYLQPTFTIHKVPCDLPIWATFGGQDVERLPSASTCYNTLKLPTYKRASTLRAKLLYAIKSNAVWGVLNAGSSSFIKLSTARLLPRGNLPFSAFLNEIEPHDTIDIKIDCGGGLIFPPPFVRFTIWIEEEGSSTSFPSAFIRDSSVSGLESDVGGGDISSLLSSSCVFTERSRRSSSDDAVSDDFETELQAEGSGRISEPLRT